MRAVLSARVAFRVEGVRVREEVRVEAERNLARGQDEAVRARGGGSGGAGWGSEGSGEGRVCVRGAETDGLWRCGGRLWLGPALFGETGQPSGMGRPCSWAPRGAMWGVVGTVGKRRRAS